MSVEAVLETPHRAPSRLICQLVPGMVAAACFATCNVLCDFVYAAGGDVLTLTLLRGMIGLAFVFVWMRIGPQTVPLRPRERIIALALGVLFAGVIYGVFAALAKLPVPIAILAFFIYPLLTGLAGSIFGLDSINWRGAAAIVAAFCGLALMIGTHPQQLAAAGVLFAAGAACCRAAILLIARARLPTADARLVTWYSLVSSTAILAAFALGTWNWAAPANLFGWIALVAVSLANAVGLAALFFSTSRVGPIRTAMIMNLEPILSAVFAWAVLGQSLTATQFAGGTIILTALIAFQTRR